jgi:hypothetical protein
MAITHTWSVDPNLKTKSQDGHDDVVYSVVWRLNSEETVGDTTYRASSWAQISLDTSDLTDFTAFADLTEAEVIAWAKATVDANATEGEGVPCEEWEAGHERNIAKQKNPPTQTQTAPWATEEPSA